MLDLRICRICLASGVKMYQYDRYYLKQYYEEVMAVKVKCEDPLPHKFCYECAAMLYKFHKFKEKCWNGQAVFQRMLSNGPITLKSISKVDRQSNNLNSRLNIITSSSKVKTYTTKSKTMKVNKRKIYLEKEIEDIVIPDIQIPETTEIPQTADVLELVDIKNDSDDSLDINLADYKNEILEKEKHNILEIMVNREVAKLEVDIKTIDNDTEELDNDMIPDIYDDRIASEDEKLNEIENNITVTDNNIKDKTKDSILENLLIETKKRKKDTKTQSKGAKKKKFEVGPEKCYLDPKHWLKVNLSEEEAIEEFNARAHGRKYLQAAFKCTNCYKGFSREDMLTRHVKLRHTESAGPAVCRFCNMRFPRQYFVMKHIAQHYTRYKCLRCDLVCDLRNTANFHNDYHNGVIRKCEHCGHEFKHSSTYYTHLRTHRSEHLCTLCGASFVSAVGLGIHARNMHLDAIISPEEAVNIYCDKCDIKFVTRKAYEEHIYHSAKHGDAADTAGDVDPSKAPAQYKLNSKFKRKGLRRNPRKQTPCPVCNKNFSSFVAYQKHHKVEHKDIPTGGKEERRICEICGASLAAGSVMAHLNTHTQSKVFSCATCGLKFNTKSSMKRHQLVHTGEKPFECSMCDKRFTQHSSVKLHFRTAHLKQPYPKRNRRKKMPDTEDILGETFRNSEDSEENLKGDRWR